MTDVALARFMDIHLDFADIKNPTLRYQKTYEVLKAEIKVPSSRFSISPPTGKP